MIPPRPPVPKSVQIRSHQDRGQAPPVLHCPDIYTTRGNEVCIILNETVDEENATCFLQQYARRDSIRNAPALQARKAEKGCCHAATKTSAGMVRLQHVMNSAFPECSRDESQFSIHTSCHKSHTQSRMNIQDPKTRCAKNTPVHQCP